MDGQSQYQIAPDYAWTQDRKDRLSCQDRVPHEDRIPPQHPGSQEGVYEKTGCSIMFVLNLTIAPHIGESVQSHIGESIQSQMTHSVSYFQWYFLDVGVVGKEVHVLIVGKEVHVRNTATTTWQQKWRDVVVSYCDMMWASLSVRMIAGRKRFVILSYN